MPVLSLDQDARANRVLNEREQFAPDATNDPRVRARAHPVSHLIDLACHGDLVGMVALLEGPDPPRIDTKSCDALTYGAAGGYREVVRQLLQRGARIEATEFGMGRTALMRAAEGGHREVVALLLEKGADIEAQCKAGQTALAYAAREGRREVVALLLESGAQLEAKDRHNWTALVHAAAEGHQEVVLLLLKRGADVSARDNKMGETAEFWAKTEQIKAMLRAPVWLLTDHPCPAGGAVAGDDEDAGLQGAVHASLLEHLQLWRVAPAAEAEVPWQEGGPARWTWEEVSRATGDFAWERLLGDGRFEKVFRGRLGGRPVAVQVVHNDYYLASRPARRREQEANFRWEVEELGRSRHFTIGELLGSCQGPDRMALVYEMNEAPGARELTRAHVGLGSSRGASCGRG
jgi:hypothetical protein